MARNGLFLLFGEMMQNMGYYDVQGYVRSLMSVPIESLYATSS